jgi:hypothetical protein
MKFFRVKWRARTVLAHRVTSKPAHKRPLNLALLKKRTLETSLEAGVFLGADVTAHCVVLCLFSIPTQPSDKALCYFTSALFSS